MRYGSLARSLWFVVGVAVILAVQPALARAQTASDNADAALAARLAMTGRIAAQQLAQRGCAGA